MIKAILRAVILVLLVVLVVPHIPFLIYLGLLLAAFEWANTPPNGEEVCVCSPRLFLVQ